MTLPFSGVTQYPAAQSYHFVLPMRAGLRASVPIAFNNADPADNAFPRFIVCESQS
jgi:hypothetical protein